MGGAVLGRVVVLGRRKHDAFLGGGAGQGAPKVWAVGHELAEDDEQPAAGCAVVQLIEQIIAHGAAIAETLQTGLGEVHASQYAVAEGPQDCVGLTAIIANDVHLQIEQKALQPVEVGWSVVEIDAAHANAALLTDFAHELPFALDPDRLACRLAVAEQKEISGGDLLLDQRPKPFRFLISALR
jgi:hypothetical protein